MPADTGVDDRRAGLFDGLGQLHDFFPDAAAFHQVEHRQAEDDNEVRAYGLAYTAHDFHRQAHAIFKAATPTVGAMVGVGGEELVDEVAFGTHDFDAVILGDLGQQRAGDKVLDLLFDALFIQFLGLERVDRCLDSARRHLLGAVGVTPGVEDLHADLATRVVHGLGDDLVLARFFLGGQLGRTGIHAAFIIGAYAAGDHQAHAATGTLSKVSGHTLETAGLFFQACVHRAHQGTVAQGGETQVQRGQQVRVGSSGHGTAPQRIITGRGALERRAIGLCPTD